MEGVHRYIHTVMRWDTHVRNQNQSFFDWRRTDILQCVVETSSKWSQKFVTHLAGSSVSRTSKTIWSASSSSSHSFSWMHHWSLVDSTHTEDTVITSSWLKVPASVSISHVLLHYSLCWGSASQSWGHVACLTICLSIRASITTRPLDTS